MPHEPSFVPRRRLIVEDFFGEHDDLEWILATNLTEALQLARAREQHELAFEIFKLRRRHKNKVVDVATALGVHPNRLTVKLHGHIPATEADLIQWCWLGERRRTYTPYRPPRSRWRGSHSAVSDGEPSDASMGS